MGASRLRHVALGAIAFALLAAGCYRPDTRNCAVVCGVDGACPHGMSCSNGFCSAGIVCQLPAAAQSCSACEASSSGSARCRGNVIETCGATGWVSESTCGGDAPACVLGACRPCQPGAARCRAGCVERCTGDGTWAETAACEACGAAPGSGLATGWTHVCSVRNGGGAALKCWGGNSDAQLGLGDLMSRGARGGELGDNLPPTPLGSGGAIVDLAAGGRHTCALFESGLVKCWGSNASGQLGLGDARDRGGDAQDMGDALPAVALGGAATALAAGGRHSCAVLESGEVKCWGDNAFGQLGLGDRESRGDGACEMGGDLPAVDLGGARALAVAAGDTHTCALLEGGRVACWGANYAGQLGLGDARNRGAQPDAPAGVVAFAPPRGAAVALAAGYAHTCALFEGGDLSCWGLNRGGQLGLGDMASPRTDPSLLAPVAVGEAVTAIAVGAFHTCALLAGGGVRCWGLNTFGQLGLGDASNRGTTEVPASLPDVDLGQAAPGVPARARAVVAGGDHTCAALEGGDIKCWGENASGQLGLGDDQPRGDDPGEMGDALPAVSLTGTARP